jgi:hypothetical protein
VNRTRILGAVLLAGALALYAWQQSAPRPAPPAPLPCPPDGPCPVPPPAPRPAPPRPWGPRLDAPVGATVGGPKHTDGTEISCDLPGELHRRNTASKGLGNCVFTSVHHSAVWQNVPALVEFPQYLIDKGIPGGGYPQKVDQLIPRICKDRNLPVPDYLQVQSNDLEILKAACRCGRMPSVTYAMSPTKRYGGSRISHMVSLVHADDRHFVVLDNNYPGSAGNTDVYEWMSPQEFLRAYSGGKTGWAVILLNGPPPPVPRNKR